MSDPADSGMAGQEKPQRLARLTRPLNAKRFEDAARHRRRVKRLRIVLPLLAALCVAAIFISLVLGGRGDSHVAGSDIPGIEMHAPVLRGIGNNGKPFQVTADQAVQTREGIIQLTNVKCQMELDDGTVTLTAKAGTLQQSTGLATADGDVQMQLGDSYHFSTEHAKMDLKGGKASGDSPVTVDGPMGKSEADGFTVEKSIRQVTFIGNVRSVIDPKAVNRAPAAATPQPKAAP